MALCIALYSSVDATCIVNLALCSAASILQVVCEWLTHKDILFIACAKSYCNKSLLMPFPDLKRTETHSHKHSF